MTYKQIDELVLKQGLTMTDVIDYVIEKNGIIGVGLISLGDGLKEYVTNSKKRKKLA